MFRNRDGGKLFCHTREPIFIEASKNVNRNTKVGLAWPFTKLRATRYVSLFLSLLFLCVPTRI